MSVRPATTDDAEAIARIYNEGIEDRVATFETRPRSTAEALEWLGAPRHPLLVAELDGIVVGWLRLLPYSERECYAGVAEGSIYVARGARGRGVGRALAEAGVRDAERLGYHKLVGLLFADNAASRALMRGCGFREVGVHRAHGRLDGVWRDVVVVERLLGGAPDR